MTEYKFLIVDAGVRYFEDATINGEEDVNGKLTPFANGSRWQPVINLEHGVVEGWPKGVQADIHFKVCDDGEYWLSRDGTSKDVKWGGYYVPNDYLCHGDNGYGDYIIMKIGQDGAIANYRHMQVDANQFSQSEDE